MQSPSVACAIKDAVSDFNHKSALALCSLPRDNKIHFLYDHSFIIKKTKHNKFITSELGFLVLPFYLISKEYCVIKPKIYAVDTISKFVIECSNRNDDIVLLENNILPKDAPKNVEYNEKKYLHSASQLIGNMQDGNLKKIVLSASKIVHYNKDDTNIIDKFLELKNKFPDNFITLHYTPKWGTWLGASPEVLMRLDEKKTLSTVALAATQLIKNGKTIEDVLWSHKEIEEQAMVSRYIINCFKKIRFRQFEEEGPFVVQMGHLAHLKTDFKVFNKHADDIFKLENDLINLLHPTSAVCGMPKQKALKLLQIHETYKRSLFAGVVGLSLQNTDTLIKNFYVNIRCVKLFYRAYQLFAGAGLTKNSNPKAELLEIKNKMSLLQQIFN